MEFHQSMVIGTSGIAGQGEIADDGWSTSIPQVSKTTCQLTPKIIKALLPGSADAECSPGHPEQRGANPGAGDGRLGGAPAPHEPDVPPEPG